MSNEMTRPVTVLIADDHGIVIDAVELSLTSAGCSVVGRAKTIDDVIAVYTALMPDVLVLDIKFTGERRTGLDAAREILKQHPDAKIVFLSQNDQDALIRETYKVGGMAFLTKDCEANELSAAVMRANHGELYFMADTAEKFANVLLRGEPDPEPSPLACLDEREKQIFELMARGKKYEEIAETMGLSKKTISNSGQIIKDKLKMQVTNDMTILAVRIGLIKLSE